MSRGEAAANLLVTVVAMTPLMLLAWRVIRRSPLPPGHGPARYRALRIRIGAGALIAVGLGLMLWFGLQLLAARE